MISTRKYTFLVIIQVLLVVGVLGGGGYFAYNKFINKDNKEEIKEEEVVVPDIQELDEDIIVVDINENIVHEGFEVSIRTPRLSNEKGSSINEKIKSDIEEYYKEKDHSIDYEYYLNGDIVSLVINIKDKDNVETFFVYNFDMNEYKLLDNHELLSVKEIKEEDVHGILINIYDSHLKENLEEGKEDIDRTTISYKKTTDKDNCNIDLPMYLDQDNHLNVIFNEYKDEVITKYIYNLNAKKVVER